MASGNSVRYANGERVFIVENGRNVRQAVVLSEKGGLYIIRFQEGGGTCLRSGRLFATAEDAKRTVAVRQEVRRPRDPHLFGY